MAWLLSMFLVLFVVFFVVCVFACVSGLSILYCSFGSLYSRLLNLAYPLILKDKPQDSIKLITASDCPASLNQLMSIVPTEDT